MSDDDFEDSDEPGAPAGTAAKVVAIVGRPNVGKSTLFNRLVGARKAIVEDNPGVTRDRLYGVANWGSGAFVVVDTGGIDPSLDDGMPSHIKAQAGIAIAEADLVLFVVDAEAGRTSVDDEVAALLRRSGKPVVVAANKADSPARERAAAWAWELGVGDVLAVSAAHGRGVAELCDAIAALLGPAPAQVELVPPGIRMAFLGRPNAGKSSLVNALVGAARVIVDDVPGTTRDAIDLPLRWHDEDFVLCDTAGLRRRRQVARAQEQLAAIKSIRAMERTHVVVLVIDATEGVTDQDQRIARMAFERGKGVVVLLHKWDLVKDDRARASEIAKQSAEALAFLEEPDLIKTSIVGHGRDAGQGHARNLDVVMKAVRRTAKALSRRISTSDLNDELQRAVAELSPPAHRGNLVRLYFATQAGVEPPLFAISANRGRSLPPAYERYLLRRFRKRWDLHGVPLRIVVRGRGRGGHMPGESRDD
ncbi:MAG: ribosome biogenesis GTPase Der [Deltaproteobacteria bacterium]|nr:ribosome biogenesis GTPase Der [Deltaproteobacteria bacterium]MBK8719871.1 ribosome biogenesis GTPase Der [Deltaproteobacteria bacterium]MBP7291784.1 ribosome biogenesis GTPase Der [Nannocystaceae bacterium]